MKKTLTASVFALSLLVMSCGSKNENNAAANNPATATPAPAAAPAATLGKKGTMLTGLIGEHPLKAIGGVAGANGMMDYSIENGKWSGTSSSIMEGEREAFDIDISKEDLQKLQSMKIVVAPDLAVSLLCNNKAYFTIPFNENEMAYSLKKAPKEYGSSTPENLQKSTTFIGGTLYLYANDALAGIEELDIAGVSADVAILSYSETDKAFDLSLFFSDCCDASNYTFKK